MKIQNIKFIFGMFVLIFPGSVLGSDFGYKDLKIGSSSTLISEKCSVITEMESDFRCYGLDNVTFSFHVIDPIKKLNTTVTGKDRNTIFYKDPRVQSWVTEFSKSAYIASYRIDFGLINPIELFVDTSENNYMSLRKSFDKKYRLDWEFTDNDFKRFLNNEKNFLLVSYENGQVNLGILRNEEGQTKFDVRYRSEEMGKDFVKDMKPKNVDTNDF